VILRERPHRECAGESIAGKARASPSRARIDDLDDGGGASERGATLDDGEFVERR
jgi:hypothetical protein